MVRLRVLTLVSVLGITGCAHQGPPVDPVDPDEALKTFQLPEGFLIDLVAAEPEVVDPVAIAFDSRGRLYAVEMRDYPLSTEPLGRIKLLEDTDGDGRFEKATVFADNLHFPHSVMPWKGGVLVAAAPDILYLEDTDGDNRVDLSKVVLTGFAQVNPQLRVNSLSYEMDNWIYAAYPKFGVGGRFKQFSELGTPIRFADRPEIAPVDIFAKGLDFRFKPDQGRLEPVSGNSEFGLAFDVTGNRFTSWNNKHIEQVVIPYRYLARNPHLIIDSDRYACSDHEEASRVYPISVSPQRTETRQTSLMSELNHFTSACGQSVYTGGGFPSEYQGAYFICEPVHNLVHGDRLIPDGITFVARRLLENKDFLASTDTWFMPVNTATGPDGALYVVDFYRKIVEHPEWIREEFMNDAALFYAGTEHGRIYRIRHNSQKLDPAPRLDLATSAELVKELSHRNRWWRLTAQRLLIERQDRSVVPLLEREATRGSVPEGRMHALWTLAGLASLKADTVVGSLQDPSPLVREQAIRLAEAYLGDDRIMARLLEMQDDESLRVQFQLACSLGDAYPDLVFQTLSSIAFRHIDDPWFQAAVLTSVTGNGERWLKTVQARVRESVAADHLLSFLRKIAEVIGARQAPAEVTDALNLVAQGLDGGDAETTPVLLEGLAEGMKRGTKRKVSLSAPGQPLLLTLIESEEPKISSPALGIAARISFQDTPRFRRTLRRAIESFDASAPVESKVRATQVLALEPGEKSESVLAGLLNPQQPEEVQDAAVEALARLTPLPVDLLLEQWSGFTVSRRDVVLDAMFENPDYIKALLDAVESGLVQEGSLSRTRKRQLQRLADPALRARANSLLEGLTSSRKEAIEKYRSAVIDGGDSSRGKDAFVKHCSKCHRLGGVGFEVGPDLVSLTNRPKEDLLANIIDPNANIVPGYEEYRVETKDGRIVTGVLLEQNANSVTLGREQGEKDNILRSNISDLRASTVSAMPEGLEEEVTVSEMTDLLEYLKSLGTRDQNASSN